MKVDKMKQSKSIIVVIIYNNKTVIRRVRSTIGLQKEKEEKEEEEKIRMMMPIWKLKQT